MSLIITGTDLSIVLFFLIAINGFFTIKKIPILALPIAGISIIFLIIFPIDFNGLSILLTLILSVCVVGNVISNYGEYHK